MSNKSRKDSQSSQNKDCPESNPKISEKASRIFEAIFGTIFTVVFFILFNVLYDRIAFLTDGFDQIKSLYNLTLLLSMTFNFTRIFIQSDRYKAATELISHAFFFYLAYWIWVNFPFDTSVIGDPDAWDKVFRGIIISTTLAVGIASIINFAKLVWGGMSFAEIGRSGKQENKRDQNRD